MEEQTTALMPNALKPAVEVEPNLVPKEEEKDWPLFYSERRDSETVLYRSRENDKEQFVDKGSHIQVLTTDPAEQSHSIKAAVQLAADRGWREIEVTGADDFRRQVWLESSLAGIQVRGYTPSPEDVAELEKLRPGSAPAPAEPELKITAVEPEQKPEWRVEVRNQLRPDGTDGVVTVIQPDGQEIGYGGLPAILNDSDLPDHIKLQAVKLETEMQERRNDPMLAHELRVGSQNDVADAVAMKEDGQKKELSPDSQERASHELFAKLGSLKERHDASSHRPEPGRGNELAAESSRHTTTGPGR